MIEIREMADIEIEEVLRRVGYGHLGCSQNDRPYVVPVHYVYDGEFIYLYTNEGKKADILISNPQVCLQVEEVVDNGNWQSVVVNGVAEPVTYAAEIEAITHMVSSRIPTPTPAMGITWINNWVAAKKERVFRIKPETRSGRTADKVDIAAAAAQPASARKPRIF
jgi:nitroimidazol reductase NimA-like FMN-containing flavoprotein (pyridoxamine 5'-phosphate oxidase superfamily)